MDIETIKQHFSIIRDDRQSAKVNYPLFDILFGSLCAVTAGAHYARCHCLFGHKHRASYPPNRYQQRPKIPTVGYCSSRILLHPVDAV
ncbi:transposase family protein [Ferrimonas sediminicola]|uniref:transposase family protein n=1 Tax=Ferrimonas sediminicola TaxID=2569538 RepID=UPI00227728C3|nr:transposase family protein [Ferrimonas sediminicola]